MQHGICLQIVFMLGWQNGTHSRIHRQEGPSNLWTCFKPSLPLATNRSQIPSSKLQSPQIHGVVKIPIWLKSGLFPFPDSIDLHSPTLHHVSAFARIRRETMAIPPSENLDPIAPPLGLKAVWFRCHFGIRWGAKKQRRSPRFIIMLCIILNDVSICFLIEWLMQLLNHVCQSIYPCLYHAFFVMHCLAIYYLPTYRPTYLSIYLSTYLPIYLSIYLASNLCIYLPTYLSIHPSIIYLSNPPPVCLSSQPASLLAAYWSVCLSVYSMHLLIYLFIQCSIHQFRNKLYVN